MAAEPSISWSPEAVDEVVAAAEWYAEQSIETASRFVETIESAIARLRSWPEIGYIDPSAIRSLRLLPFPFRIHYRLGTDGIEVLALAHVRRSPGYWRERGDQGH